MAAILPSEEQQQIIAAIGETDVNLVVNSVAGSGKSTTIALIAEAYPHLSILCLTFNRVLKEEFRVRIVERNIENLEVHNYHSMAVRYYDGKAYTDNTMQNYLNNPNDNTDAFAYDMIIIDEAQDMSKLYFDLICQIYNDCSTKPKICIIGDDKQCIFQFNGSDPRFITMFPQLWNRNDYKWLHFKLSTSYRLPIAAAVFVNDVMLGEHKIIPRPNANMGEVRYLACNPFTDMPYNELRHMLTLFAPDEIFVLAPSMKSQKSPVMRMENKIKTEIQGINVYVSNNDSDKLDDKDIEGKLVFSTLHQIKGLERKCVIVFGFDSDYFKYYAKTDNINVCPNTLYVAATRCTHSLTVIQDVKNDCLQFINPSLLTSRCSMIGAPAHMIKSSKECSRIKQRAFAIVELTKFLHFTVINECAAYLDSVQVDKARGKINIKTSTDSGETTYDISGVAIPAAFEMRTSGKLSIHDNLIKNGFLNKLDNAKFKPTTLHELNKIDPANATIGLILFIANCWVSFMGKHVHKLYQITEYDWLSPEHLDACFKYMEVLNISKNATFEVPVNINVHGTIIRGAVDCIDDAHVYEFKCVNKLTNEHRIQLGIYAYIIETERQAKIDKFREDHPEINFVELLSNYSKLDDCRKQMCEIMATNTIGEEITFTSINDNSTGIITRVFKTTGTVEVQLANKTKIKVPNRSILTRNNADVAACQVQIEELSITIIMQMQHIDPNEIKFKFASNEDVLFNLLTGERVVISSDLTRLQKMMDILLDAKLNPKQTMSNDKFIEQAITHTLNKPAVVAAAAAEESDNEYDSYDDEIFTVVTPCVAKKGNYADEEYDMYDPAPAPAIVEEPKRENMFAAENVGAFIVLDTETPGFGCNNLIQLAYIVYDAEFNQIKSVNHLINENIGKRDFFKKSTVAHIKKEGKHPKEVFDELSRDFAGVSHVICHNSTFDIKLLELYYKKLGMPNVIPKIICTMKTTRDYCGLKNKAGKSKAAKLEELYTKCFGSGPDTELTHDALYDVKITFECFRYLCGK